MQTITTTLIAIVALLHIYFLILEMFLWDKPFGMRIFGHSKDTARLTKTLAMNQGLYNGFLAAGLIWALYLNEKSFDLKIFLLTCIILAGSYAGFTVNKKIFWVQAFPAIMAILALLFG